MKNFHLTVKGTTRRAPFISPSHCLYHSTCMLHSLAMSPYTSAKIRALAAHSPLSSPALPMSEAHPVSSDMLSCTLTPHISHM